MNPSFFGSAAGGWLFVDTGNISGQKLINVKTDHSIQLPCRIRWPLTTKSEMILRAATLSADPATDRTCFCAAIASPLDPPYLSGSTIFACWRLGCKKTTVFNPIDDLDDVVFFGNHFYFISRSGSLWRALANVKSTIDDKVHLLTERVNINTLEQFGDCLLISRYLVKSRGHLLLLNRIGDLSNRRTTRFDVYIMVDLGSQGSTFQWSPLPGLDGCVIFTSRGNSKSYEVIDGLLDEGVYFIDERSFSRAGNQPFQVSYPCVDNGHWSSKNGHVSQLYVVSKKVPHSGPSWFYP